MAPDLTLVLLTKIICCSSPSSLLEYEMEAMNKETHDRWILRRASIRRHSWNLPFRNSCRRTLSFHCSENDWKITNCTLSLEPECTFYDAASVLVLSPNRPEEFAFCTTFQCVNMMVSRLLKLSPAAGDSQDAGSRILGPAFFTIPASTCTGLSNWTSLRKLKYFLCCLIDLFLF